MTDSSKQPKTWGITHLPPESELDILLAKTKGRLFMKKGAGYLGSLLCSHDFVWDTECDTAWNNGATIGFSPYFFYALDAEGRVTLLAHELWHTGYDHFSRLGNRCPDVWNIAGDYVINNDLDNMGYSFTRLMELAPGACLDHQHDNKTTEQIYAELDPQGGGGGGQSPGDMGGDIKIDEGTPSKEDMMGKIVKAQQASCMAKEAGVIPGEIQEIIEEFLSPVLPWEVLLHRFFNEMDASDYSWKRPNRRYEDDYLPTMHSDNGLEHLIYYLDVSGSITTAQALRFFSEVKSIHEDLVPKRLTMVTFDTKIQDIYELEEGDPFQKFEITGRGGTSLTEVQEHIAKHKPSAAVIFSDMYVSPMRENPGSPILWAVMDNKNAKVPFGHMVHIKDTDL